MGMEPLKEVGHMVGKKKKKASVKERDESPGIKVLC